MIPIETVTKLEHFFRPFLSKFLRPNFLIKTYSATRSTYLKELANYSKKMPIVEGDFYPQKLFDNQVCFRNDLGNAAGFDKDGSLIEFNYKLGAGFALVGTVLHRPHVGNLINAFGKKVNPWVPLSNSGSALNSLGLPNKGVDVALQNIQSFRNKYPSAKNNFPIGISLMSHPLDSSSEQLTGLLESVKKVASLVDFVEINESCPNCNHDQEIESFHNRITQIINLRNSLDQYLPILLKLGALNQASESIKLFSELGIDGIALTNTQKNYPQFLGKVDLADQRLMNFYTEHYQGGLSGLVIKDFALKQVQEAHLEIIKQQSKIRIIHVGGIFNQQDILESREYSSIILREWYTGLLHQMGTTTWSKIYSSLLASRTES